MFAHSVGIVDDALQDELLWFRGEELCASV